MVFDERRARNLGEGYGRSSLPGYAGFLTYRYLLLFARDTGRLSDGSLRDSAGLSRYAGENNLLDLVIHMERLEDDLVAVLGSLGVAVSAEAEALIWSTPPTNTSSRRRDFGSYYDPETAGLVAERENLIVARFGYVSPV